jgi:hypothetical protein
MWERATASISPGSMPSAQEEPTALPVEWEGGGADRGETVKSSLPYDDHTGIQDEPQGMRDCNNCLVYVRLLVTGGEDEP